MFMLNEELICYLWTYQYFDKNSLINSLGQPIKILHPGIRNHNQGPDFSQARIMIDDLEWYGHVEIHVKASEWVQHHRGDTRYDNTILHVVWNNNTQVFRTDGTEIPALELNSRVSESLLQQCSELLYSKEDPACRSHWPSLPSIYAAQMFERSAAEKLETKSTMLLQSKQTLHLSWEELLWQSLALAMMRKLNRMPMEVLLRLLDYKILYRHRDSIPKLEALLLGQSGLLTQDPNSSYAVFLQREFEYLSAMFHLESPMQRSHWSFLRTRPGNFPQVRLIQLSRFLQKIDMIKELLLTGTDISALIQVFRSGEPAEKDQYHFLGIQDYHLDAGIDTVHSLLINSMAPWLVAYSSYYQQPVFADKALEWLEKIPAENNKITRVFKNPDFKLHNALESQGAIWLYEQYCQRKKCLHCRIGCKILHGVVEHSV